jgi:protein gp37
MADTKIEWCDKVWNPTTGCSKISAGCVNCYAERIANRFWGDRNFTDVRCHPERLNEPLKWRKPQKIFVNSMSDLFYEDVPFEFIDKVFAAMSAAWRQTFIILTKRPERMKQYINSDRPNHKRIGYNQFGEKIDWPLKNVWLGVTVENQEQDWRIKYLLETSAAVRFVSVEPMLETLNVKKYLWPKHQVDGTLFDAPISVSGYDLAKLAGLNGLDWVICGGETGPGARPMHPDWVRSLRDQCVAAGVPFFFKSWGEWTPRENLPHGLDTAKNFNRIGHFDEYEECFKKASISTHGQHMVQVSKKAAGALLDDREWRQFPCGAEVRVK